MSEGVAAHSPRRGPWGPFATIGFAVVVATVFTLAQVVVAIPYLMLQTSEGSGADLDAAAAGLESDGTFFAFAEVVSGTVAVGLILFLAWVRKGPSVREYLGLRATSGVKLLKWLTYTVLAGILIDGVTSLLGYSVVPTWVESVYRSASNLPLLLVSILVVAPVVEELFFRAFVFEGLRKTLLGDAGSVALTSLTWACIHLQYDWIYIGQIFLLGLLLGAARVRTGSIVPPILMHSLYSGIATIQVLLGSGS